MAHRLLHRFWQVIFATSVASGFVWFCVFWSETFVEEPGVVAEAAVAPKVVGPDCANGTPALDVAPKAASTDGSELAELGEDDDSGAEPTTTRAAMFQTRIFGPYALSVRDGLNEMLIDTHLIAQGIQAATDPNASLDAVMQAIPSRLPSDGYLTSGFGLRQSPFTGRIVQHNGVDFAVGYGDRVYATADGVVTYSGWYTGLGKAVMIDHGYGISTRYGHNSALAVKVGDVVHRGQVIAAAGSTGRSTGTHVHYEVRINDRPIDPAQFMFEVPDQAQAVVAMDPYAGRHPSPGLGLAMGGDEPTRSSRSPGRGAAAPERLPWNLAIMGTFAAAALALILSLVPRNSSG